jgi:hypothetical protein
MMYFNYTLNTKILRLKCKMKLKYMQNAEAYSQWNLVFYKKYNFLHFFAYASRRLRWVTEIRVVKISKPQGLTFILRFK